MESPRTNQESPSEQIVNQQGSQEGLTSEVAYTQVAKSSENTNIQDYKSDIELRSQATPNQEGDTFIEVSAPHKGSGEDVHRLEVTSPEKEKIQEHNDNVTQVVQHEEYGNRKNEVKVTQEVEHAKEKTLLQQLKEAQEENPIAKPSVRKASDLIITVSTASEEFTEDKNKEESPGTGSRLKDRSPNLKLLVVTTQSAVQQVIQGATSSGDSETEATTNVDQNAGHDNHHHLKKSYSSNQVSAPEEEQNTQSSPPGMKRVISVATMNSNNVEENKNEPASASQPGQKQRLSLEDFHKITSVGKGSYGEVFLVKKISNNKLYALKSIDKNFMKKEKKEHQVYVEREVLLKLNHPNIIRLYSSFQDKVKLYFVLEYVSGGEFSDYLRIQGKLTKDQIIFFAAEIINILEYLHGHGIAHRDMKPENLLLTQEGHLKCIDFGTAKFLATDKRTSELFASNKPPEEGNAEAKPVQQKRNHRSTFVGTAQYVSPEMLEGSDCGAPADLWALGCMIYLMTVGQFPFTEANEYLIFQKIKSVIVKYPEDMDLEIKDLIQKLLVKDPFMRLGAGSKGSKNDYENLKAHTLFKGVEFNKIHEQKPPMIEIASPHKTRRSHDFEPTVLVANPQQARKHFHSDDLSRPDAAKETENKIVEFPTDKAIRVILSGLVLKKTGWLFYRPRQLILNSKPRLVYYDPDSNQLKGEIPLAPSTKAELESKTKFIITTPNKKYVFKEMEHSAEKWVEIINTAVQQLYAKKPEN